MTECIQFSTEYKLAKGGYGRRTYLGQGHWAHRDAYAEEYGEIPQGAIVRHICDNPACVNPEHLLLGTQLENIQDRVNRDRSAKGLANARTKMTPEKIWIAQTDPRSAREVAKDLEVSHTSVLWARNKKTFLSREN